MFCLGIDFLLLASPEIQDACTNQSDRLRNSHSTHCDTPAFARTKISCHIICRRSSTAHELAHRLTVKRRPRISANARTIAQHRLATPQSPFQNNFKHAPSRQTFELPACHRESKVTSSRLALPVSPAQDLSHHGHRSRHPPAHRLR